MSFSLYNILIIHFIPLGLHIYIHKIYCIYLTAISTRGKQADIYTKSGTKSQY